MVRRSLHERLLLSTMGADSCFGTGRYGVMLDKRTLKTPGGSPVLLSQDQLPIAVLIAEEWENQLAVLKPHTLPMVSQY